MTSSFALPLFFYSSTDYAVPCTIVTLQNENLNYSNTFDSKLTESNALTCVSNGIEHTVQFMCMVWPSNHV